MLALEIYDDMTHDTKRQLAYSCDVNFAGSNVIEMKKQLIALLFTCMNIKIDLWCHRYRAEWKYSTETNSEAILSNLIISYGMVGPLKINNNSRQTSISYRWKEKVCVLISAYHVFNILFHFDWRAIYLFFAATSYFFARDFFPSSISIRSSGVVRIIRTSLHVANHESLTLIENHCLNISTNLRFKNLIVISICSREIGEWTISVALLFIKNLDLDFNVIAWCPICPWSGHQKPFYILRLSSTDRQLRLVQKSDGTQCHNLECWALGQ